MGLASENRIAEIYSFGPFRLNSGERVLQRAGVQVALGSRAFNLLSVLVENAGEIVSADDLLKAAWPGLVVTPDNVRVQLAQLRAMLGDGKDRASYIENVPGKGYRFVAQVQRVGLVETRLRATPRPSRTTRLPSSGLALVGRDRDVDGVSALLRQTRCVTVAGPGGIGKTTLATAIAQALSDEFERICFFDLSQIVDASRLNSELAQALGLATTSQDPLPALLADLQGVRILLVLDGCEHLIDSVARLVETVFLGTSGVHFLVTSRESMRAAGEHVYSLSGLLFPLESPASASEAMAFPAIQLFVERVAAALGHFELSDAQAPIVARICRRLDGMPLAIEIVAGRVGAFGIEGIEPHLDNHFVLSWTGRRTALPRQRTLRNTIDWSFNFLPDPERVVLQRLSVLPGAFTLEAARAVAAGGEITEDAVVDAVVSFVTQSLLKVTFEGLGARYRLLDTTRTYLQEKLSEAGESSAAAERHARWVLTLLERADAMAADRLRTAFLADQGDALGNVRLALEWSFLSQEHQTLAVAIAGLAAPVFVESSQFLECIKWSARALASLNSETAGTPTEVELRLCYGWSLMSTNGNSEEARTSFQRALDLAEELQLNHQAFRVVGLLHMLVQRMGEVQGALDLAARAEKLASPTTYPAAQMLAEWLLGLSHHFAGDQTSAARFCASARDRSAAADSIGRIHFGFDHRIRAVSTLARAMFLQGRLDQAMEVMTRLFAEPDRQTNGASLCFPLIWTVPLFIEFGERSVPEGLLARLTEIATKYSLKPYISVAAAWGAILKIRHGEVDDGIVQLEDALLHLETDRYDVLNTRFHSALADAYGMSGQAERAIVLINETIDRAELTGEVLHLPDMYRIKGDLLSAHASAPTAAAEACYSRAVELAERQGALYWRLKAEISRARLALRDGPNREAVERLATVYGLFSEGFESRDLLAARQILETELAPSLQ